MQWIDDVLQIALERMPKPLTDEEYRALEQAAQKADAATRISTH